ncbi:hypothetical protein M758_6G014800 [Ceratodon purpureus]|nr:hypothetical protein M758_6G014800 [Ceratodon purpureus]
MENTLKIIVMFMVMQALGLVAGQGGSWQVLQKIAGIASMHTAITNTDQAILLDRTNEGATKLGLPGGRCRNQPLERVLKKDCWAHSVMLNPGNGAVRALSISTDTGSSSGQFMGNGVLVQTGGDFEGIRKIRTLTPCGAGGNCDWVETKELLAKARSYSTNHILPGGDSQIIVGGRNEPTYEFYPKRKPGEGVFPLNKLKGFAQNSLYPFVFLLNSRTLFIFAGRDSLVWDYVHGGVITYLPTMPGNPRTFPNGGSAVMLPFRVPWYANEFLICGGAAAGAATSGNGAAPATASCGRIIPMTSSANPQWKMEDMPIRRVMGDMVNLPNGQVLIINGAQNGYQGLGKAGNPALNPVLYSPDAAAGKRFQVMAKSTIPRMFHSTANLLSDGRVLIAGSNTHQFYTDTGAFPTELRVEAYSPPYLSPTFDTIRPRITASPKTIAYQKKFFVTFAVEKLQGDALHNKVQVMLMSAPYSTHSFAQGQRAIQVGANPPIKVGAGWQVQATGPVTDSVMPQQYYMLFIVHAGIPSKAVWVQLAGAAA